VERRYRVFLDRVPGSHWFPDTESENGVGSEGQPETKKSERARD
jgi:hypothetical protein